MKWPRTGRAVDLRGFQTHGEPGIKSAALRHALGRCCTAWPRDFQCLTVKLSLIKFTSLRRARRDIAIEAALACSGQLTPPDPRCNRGCDRTSGFLIKLVFRPRDRCSEQNEIEAMFVCLRFARRISRFSISVHVLTKSRSDQVRMT
jgi:hypothetical protein